MGGLLICQPTEGCKYDCGFADCCQVCRFSVTCGHVCSLVTLTPEYVQMVMDKNRKTFEKFREKKI